MRHKVDGRLFGRPANQRKALLRGLVTSLIEHQRIETTVAKAKEAKRIAERMITFAIKGDLHSKRQVFSYIPDRSAASRLFSEIAPRFSGRNGGYLRIVQTRYRLKDSAPLAVLEFIDYEAVKQPKKKAKKAEKESSKEQAVPRKKEAKKTAGAEKKETKKTGKAKKVTAGKKEAKKSAKTAKAEGDAPRKASRSKKAEPKEK